MYTVGRLARRFGLSRSTLLYYDSIGLLRPSQHAKGDYRQYSEADAERLRSICTFREAGLSLKDIGRILDTQGDSELGGILEGRLMELCQEMETLRQQQRLAANLLGRPELLEEDREAMDRTTWSSLLASSGFSEADMRRWHTDFERMAPEKHERFLKFLRIPEHDRAMIRSWAEDPQDALEPQKTTENSMDLIYQIFEGLERKGPGSGVDTTKAFAMCGDLPGAPRILEIGCGSGVTSVELAQISGGHVTATDIHQPYLDEVNRKARALGIGEQVTTVRADMADLPFDPESFDLIWSEGAAYIMGLEKALAHWKRFLTPGGYLVVSEAVIHRDDPPEELRTFWAEGYPDVRTVEENLTGIKKLGYEVLGHFPLPEQCWHFFYDDLEKHMEGMEERYQNDPKGQAVLEENRKEIALYRRFPGYYGYEFFVLRK